MGTSSSNGGPGNGTPLVPTWVDGGGAGPQPPLQMPQDAPPAPPPERLPPESPPDPYRFTAPRTNLTRFARSGGTDRASLGRAMSQYVSGASGGAQRAAQRMGRSRVAGAGLLGFLIDAGQRGPAAALATLNLEQLAGRPAGEVFAALVDQLCPEGGSIDEGIARDAFIEMIVDLEKEGIQDFDELTADQMQTVFELYVAHAIEGRICNDIGMNVVALPADSKQAAKVEAELRHFIQRAVSDAVHRLQAELKALTAARVRDFVDQIYESAFALLQAHGDAEAKQ